MFQDVVLIHRSGQKPIRVRPEGPAAAEFAPPVLAWKTCLRQVVFASLDVLPCLEIEESDDVLIGTDAFRFCLQIVCGLHSPLIGETEVYGQFKNAVAQFQIPATPWGSQMQKFFRAIFADAKKVRAKHLEDLGSQSYGSVIRRDLKGLKSVHFLGAGQLVQEILPWVCKDGIEVHVHCRNPDRVRAELGQFKGLRVHDLSARVAPRGALVICAPVTAAWIRDWLGPSEQGGKAALRSIIDLRGDSGEDALTASGPVVVLAELLSRISANQEFLEARKRAALEEIERSAEERARHVEYRPFGWEDVCA